MEDHNVQLWIRMTRMIGTCWTSPILFENGFHGAASPSSWRTSLARSLKLRGWSMTQRWIMVNHPFQHASQSGILPFMEWACWDSRPCLSCLTLDPAKKNVKKSSFRHQNGKNIQLNPKGGPQTPTKKQEKHRIRTTPEQLRQPKKKLLSSKIQTFCSMTTRHTTDPTARHDYRSSMAPPGGPPVATTSLMMLVLVHLKSPFWTEKTMGIWSKDEAIWKRFHEDLQNSHDYPMNTTDFALFWAKTWAMANTTCLGSSWAQRL